MDQMPSCIWKLRIAKHCANGSSEHKHQAQMTRVRHGLKALKKSSLLLPAHSDIHAIVFELCPEADLQLKLKSFV